MLQYSITNNLPTYYIQEMTSHLTRINKVILRHVPHTLESALTSIQNVVIDVNEAVKQHQLYMDVIQNELPKENIFICAADDNYPDCVFVEDSAVMISPDAALLTHMGNETRRGESHEILSTFKKLGLQNIIDMRDYEGAYMDGGDVLNTGRHFFVGKSTRTNEAGIQVLKDALKMVNSKIPVVSVPVPNTLHYKCCITCVDEYNLIISDTVEGRNLIQSSLQLLTSDTDENHIGSQLNVDKHNYNLHYVENDVAANIVRMNNVLIVPQNVNEKSQTVYNNLINTIDGLDEIKHVPNGEFTKIDGSLTCRSILLWE